jgi:hypothetical protein
VLIEIGTFVVGLGLGAVPSIWTFYALKKDIYIDTVMKAISPEQTFPQEHISLSKPPKEISTETLGEAFIRHAELNPDDWTVYDKEKPFNKKGTNNYYFGVRNNKDNFECLRNTLTFSKATDIYLNDINIDAHQFSAIVNGVTRAVNQGKMRKLLEVAQKPRPLAIENMSELAQKGWDNLENLAKAKAADLITSKEAGGKLIDPFAETYNDQIYKIGKAQEAMKKRMDSPIVLEANEVR